MITSITVNSYGIRNIETYESFFAEHIRRWYDLANEDYNVTGSFQSIKLIENQLIVTVIENEETFNTTLCWIEDYTLEQLWDIWCEFGFDE